MQHRFKQYSDEDVACMDCGYEPWHHGNNSTDGDECPARRHPSNNEEALIARFGKQLDALDHQDLDAVLGKAMTPKLGWRDALAWVGLGTVLVAVWLPPVIGAYLVYRWLR